jgi:ATP-dependent Clp protease ATP-binding subunit ClpB
VRQLLAQRGVSLSLTDVALDLLIEEGYDPMYGARPLKRVLQGRLIDPLALQIIQGDIREGDHVVVEAADDELPFTITDSVRVPA